MSTLFGFALRRRTSEVKALGSPNRLDAAGAAAAHDSCELSLAERVLAGMPGALLVVTGEGLVEGAYAHTEILGETVIGAPVHEVLGIPDDGAAGLVQLWIASVIGQDTGAWDIYADQAPRTASLRAPAGDGAVSYAIDCSPLVGDDGVVERIMLHVRPAVAGEGATTQAVATGPTPEQLELFACEASGLVADCQSAFERLVADPAARHAVHHLFRSLHTLKGTARAFGIVAVQEAAHAAEDCVPLRAGSRTPAAVSSRTNSLGQCTATPAAARCSAASPSSAWASSSDSSRPVGAAASRRREAGGQARAARRNVSSVSTRARGPNSSGAAAVPDHRSAASASTVGSARLRSWTTARKEPSPTSSASSLSQRSSLPRRSPPGWAGRGSAGPDSSSRSDT